MFNAKSYNYVFTSILLSILITFTFIGIAQAQEQSIGKILEMKGSVTIIRSSGEKVDGSVGLEIFKDDEIRTGGASAAKIEFNDKTVLTLFENSEIKISEFVYVPATNKRDAVVDLVKGQVRSAVSKTLAEDSSYKVKTRNAVMGIRGTTTLSKAKKRGFTPVTIHAVTEGMAMVAKSKQDVYTEGTPLSRGMMATFIGSKDPVIEMWDPKIIPDTSEPLEEPEKVATDEPLEEPEEVATEEIIEEPTIIDPLGPDDRLQMESPLVDPLLLETPQVDEIQPECPLY